MESYISEVPQDYEDLWVKHQKFFPHVIRGMAPWLSPEDVEDLTMTALQFAISRDYLADCRAYEQTCRVQNIPYNVLSSLRQLTANVVLHHQRDRIAAKRDARKTSSLHADVHEKTEDRGPRRMPRALQVEATQEDEALAAQLRSRMRQRLAHGMCVIGGEPALAVFDRAVATDGEIAKYERRRLKRFFKGRPRA